MGVLAKCGIGIDFTFSELIFIHSYLTRSVVNVTEASIPPKRKGPQTVAALIIHDGFALSLSACFQRLIQIRFQIRNIFDADGEAYCVSLDAC